MEQTQKRPPLTEEQKRDKIVRSFIRDGKLASIPVKTSKREVVLEYITKTMFEPGRTYAEAEVNDILRPFYEDFCTLRRDLVDGGYIRRERNGSVYEVVTSLCGE